MTKIPAKTPRKSKQFTLGERIDTMNLLNEEYA